MTRTGQINERAGLYRSTCCSRSIHMTRGTKFPACKKCGKSIASWTFIRPLTSDEQNHSR